MTVIDSNREAITDVPNPVLLVASGPLHLPEGSRIHGLVFVNHPGQDAFRASSGEIRGAVVACGDLRLDGNSRLHHDRAVLDAVRLLEKPCTVVQGFF